MNYYFMWDILACDFEWEKTSSSDKAKIDWNSASHRKDQTKMNQSRSSGPASAQFSNIQNPNFTSELCSFLSNLAKTPEDQYQGKIVTNSLRKRSVIFLVVSANSQITQFSTSKWVVHPPLPVYSFKLIIFRNQNKYMTSVW